MKVAELIARLQELDPALEIAILDGFNGGGHPRTINYGPVVHTYDESDIVENKASGITPVDLDDIHSPINTPVVLMGYGCY